MDKNSLVTAYTKRDAVHETYVGRFSQKHLLNKDSQRVSDVRMMANYWLRLGNTSASTNYLSFLEDTLSKLEGKRVGLVRMDNGFFAKETLDYSKNKELADVIACCFNNRIKYSLTHERKWIELTDGLEISETIYQANGWEKLRRIVMVRQEIEKRPKAAGKQIKQLDLFEDE